MIPFIYVNDVVFCFVMIAYLIVSFIGVVSFAMGIVYKLKSRYILPELLVSLIAILMFCYLSDVIRIRYFGENISNNISILCFMQVVCVILILAVLSFFAIYFLVLVIKMRLSSLTSMSIKESISLLPTSLCFYEDSGRVLFLNEQITKDCKELTGKPLYDGNDFWDSIRHSKITNGTIVTYDNNSVIIEYNNGKVKLYKQIIHYLAMKKVYELSGTDITREFALKKEIEQKNQNLRKMNMRLKKYGEIVTEVTREKEILAVRIKVHGNLGSLILQTKKALTYGEYDRQNLVSLWNDLLSLIFVSDSDKNDIFADVEKTASSVGVCIIYDGKRPNRGTVAEKIFATAVSECVTNVARHANGDKLYVKLRENDISYSIELTNNGKQPTKEVKEGGGLKSLRTMVENSNGQMLVKSIPIFSLNIIILKDGHYNE